MASAYLNTLFVTTPGAYVFRDHENLIVKVGDEEKLRVPMHHLGSVVCFGALTVSVGAIEACAEHGLGLSFLSENGRFLARVEGEPNGSIEVRRAQHAAAADPARTLALARSFVLGKLFNSRQLLLRAARETDDASDQAKLREPIPLFDSALRAVPITPDLDSLRGREGDCARSYFGAFSRDGETQPRGLWFHPTQPPSAARSDECADVVSVCLVAPRLRVGVAVCRP